MLLIVLLLLLVILLLLLLLLQLLLLLLRLLLAVRLLRDRVQRLARDAAASPGGRPVGPELTVLAYGLTIWLGILALLSLAAGYMLLRL